MREAFGLRRCALAVLLAGAAGAAQAADLDAAPHVIQGTGPAIPSNCRYIPQPQFNLTQEDVIGAKPQLVCFSRGLLADSMQPYRRPPSWFNGFFDFWR